MSDAQRMIRTEAFYTKKEESCEELTGQRHRFGCLFLRILHRRVEQQVSADVTRLVLSTLGPGFPTEHLGSLSVPGIIHRTDLFPPFEEMGGSTCPSLISCLSSSFNSKNQDALWDIWGACQRRRQSGKMFLSLSIS